MAAQLSWLEHSVHTRSVIGSNPIAATIWPGGQAVKTPPFHGGNTSSILVRVTKDDVLLVRRFFFYLKVYFMSLISPFIQRIELGLVHLTAVCHRQNCSVYMFQFIASSFEGAFYFCWFYKIPRQAWNDRRKVFRIAKHLYFLFLIIHYSIFIIHYALASPLSVTLFVPPLQQGEHKSQSHGSKFQRAEKPLFFFKKYPFGHK